MTRAAAATVPLVWERLPARRRSRPSALSLDAIVSAAMRVADAEGLDAVSMRRVGAALDAGAMSLYRYVTRKEDLLDLLLDAAFAEIRVPASAPRAWRPALRALASETRAALKRHPWLGALLSTRPPLGPHYLRYFEYALQCVARLSATPADMERLVRTFSVFVMGFVGYELAEADAARRAGLSEAEKFAAIAPYLERLFATGAFPHLAAYVAIAHERPDDRDFAFGLECVLDGLAARVMPAPRGAARPRRIPVARRARPAARRRG